jgi:hypothetical protein
MVDSGANCCTVRLCRTNAICASTEQGLFSLWLSWFAAARTVPRNRPRPSRAKNRGKSYRETCAHTRPGNHRSSSRRRWVGCRQLLRSRRHCPKRRSPAAPGGPRVPWQRISRSISSTFEGGITTPQRMGQISIKLANPVGRGIRRPDSMPDLTQNVDRNSIAATIRGCSPCPLT